MQGSWILSISGQRRSCRSTRIVRAAILFLLSVVSVTSLLATPAFAFKISPFTAEMAPAGPRAKLDYVVENDTSDPTAVQISVVRREQAEDGSETLPEADDEFLVFPAQLIVLPKEKRTVRLQWLGPIKPERELAYRLVAEQLPVDLGRPGEGKKNLQLLVKYQTALYIVPPGIRSNPARDLVVQRAEPSRDHDSGQTMDVYLVNRGLAHVHLTNAQLTATSLADGKTVTLSSLRLTGSMAGENVLAGSVRRFSIPWPTELAVGPVSVTLELKGAP